MSGARHGWILEWFVKDDDTLVDRVDVIDMTVEELQDVFDEPSADSMMCYSYRVGAEHVESLRRHVGCEIDLRRFDYFVSGWSERGFRTPAGLYPPPRISRQRSETPTRAPCDTCPAKRTPDAALAVHACCRVAP